MTDTFDYLIIGGGRSAASAVEELVAQGVQGHIAIVGAEPHLPYDRPPLSKGFLLGSDDRESLTIEDQDFYRQNGVELILGHRVVRLNTPGRTVDVDDGRTLRFEKLLIATGARVRTLDIPGSDVAGVHYLRTVEDSQSLHAAAQSSRRAVVIGTGFIGMEVASALRQMGLETTIVDRTQVLYGRFLSAEISGFFATLYAENDVRLVHGTTPVAFRGRGKVESVILDSGEALPCDMVAIGVGVVPDVAFLDGSGLGLENGIIVDEHLETNVPGIFAAGDVANFWDRVFGKRRRVEHWDTAKNHGVLAARNMLGLNEPYASVSYFFSDVFDVSFDFIGDTDGCDRTVMRGSRDARSFAAFYLSHGRLRAAFFLGRPMRERTDAENLIKRKADLSDVLSHLEDPAMPLSKLG